MPYPFQYAERARKSVDYAFGHVPAILWRSAAEMGGLRACNANLPDDFSNEPRTGHAADQPALKKAADAEWSENRGQARHRGWRTRLAERSKAAAIILAVGIVFLISNPIGWFILLSLGATLNSWSGHSP
jgi:hypothetical protein